MNNKSTYIFRIAITVALGGFILGFDASVISGTIKFVRSEFLLNEIQVGWLVSSITLTAALGTFISGQLSDKYGRRRVLKFAAVLFAISALGSALAPSFIVLILARLIGGFAVGAALIIAPVYIAEVSPPSKRGQMVSFNQLNIVVGISIAFFTNYFILKLGDSGVEWLRSIRIRDWNWRWMLGLELLPALLYYIGLNRVPRSPRWLTLNGAEKEALQVMERFTSAEDALTQMENIHRSIEKDKHREKIHIKEIFRKNMRLVLTIGLVVAVFQQLVGINSVMFFAPMIFEQTGIGTDASFLQAILVGLTNLVFTIIAMAIIDRLGRKPLLVYGMLGMAICLFVMVYGFKTASYTLTEDALSELSQEVNTASLAPLANKTFENDLDFRAGITEVMGEDYFMKNESNLIAASAEINGLLILIGILGFVGSFAVSIGPCMWVLFAELFPNRIRGVTISFVGLVNLAIAFSVQLVFPWELKNFGNTTTFLIYAICAVIGLVFIIVKVPETKGKSLEELEAQLVLPDGS